MTLYHFLRNTSLKTHAKSLKKRNIIFLFNSLKDYFFIGLLVFISPFSFAEPIDTLEKRLSDLEKEIKTLKQALEKHQKPQTQKGVKINNDTRLEYGGFIKADFLFNDYSDGDRALASIGDDLLVPPLIPVGNNNAPNDITFDSHVKHSRFWFRTTSDVNIGKVISYIETDFNSGVDERIANQASNGLRHAFLKWQYNDSDSLLIGQTWSTFFNVAGLPESVDFIGPSAGTLFNRQSQIRWTYGFSNTSSIMLAAENPSSSLNDGGIGFSSNQFDSNSLPDFIVRFNNKSDTFHYSIAGIIREIAYNESNQTNETVGFAANFTGIYQFSNRDKLKFSLSHGTLGRYIALNGFRDGVIESNGDIDLFDTTGGFISYQHFWNDQFRSTLTYAVTSTDNPDIAGETVNKQLTSANANVMYSPFAKLTFGVAYIFAERELENGDDGTLNRVHFTSKWVF